MTTVEQRKEMREFADNMGSDIPVSSIQYQLAKMVWTLVDELNAVPVEAIETVFYSDSAAAGFVEACDTVGNWLVSVSEPTQAVQP